MNSSERHSPQQLAFSGLDLLSSAVVVLDERELIRHMNPAAENLFAVAQRAWLGHPLAQLLGSSKVLVAALENVLKNNWSYTGHNIEVARGDQPALHVDCTVTPIEAEGAGLLLEFRPIDQQLRAVREEREAVQQQANRELIRNLAHEIKNPLGGIRGSAQLLERELSVPALREYTQVIISEVDRLQDLMQRLLSSHRTMQPAQINIHEILERVLRLIHAEFSGVRVRRDYDTSLPELTGDREQLIQAILNIARNAAQAMNGQGEIVFRTRSLRKVTLAKKHYALALELQVIDNGPGIAENIRDKIFYPLVSGRENGSGLGLTLTQSFIHQHHGTIEVESRPGRTSFRIMLPLMSEQGNRNKS
ncbi:sensory histidine kinase in two-component regulatory system with GlnG [Georgfuchsia toluolica]|uniref:Sensory histidine kinase/phosphatase NtrB n=1 Tax=Georgfuchsia toluolica TaxID=424218 RepID=A0A916NII2_9PROT|nr:nitrogen regulation protein NR(II) [Georgfuchsia toluolica]CAG4884561.1 sensory histidine kinase in two-component regulatory system with GlnG [Georgfuchsia toluolica]